MNKCAIISLLVPPVIYRSMIFLFIFLINISLISESYGQSMSFQDKFVSLPDSICLDSLNKNFARYQRDSFRVEEYFLACQNLLKNRNIHSSVERCIEVSNNLAATGYFGEAIEMIDWYLEFFHVEQFDKKARLLTEKGSILLRKGEYKKAKSLYDTVLGFYSERNDLSPRLANLYNNLGIVHKYLGKYQVSLDYHLESLSLKELLQDSTGMLQSLNNIGHVYYYWERYDKASQYFQEAADLSAALGQEVNIAILSNNLGSIYLETKNYDKALDYFRASLKIYREREMAMYEGIILGNIGNVYKEKGLLGEALVYHERALAIYEQTDNTYQLVHCYLNLGEMYYLMDKYDKAKQMLEKFLSKTKENPVIDLELKAYNILSKLSKKNRDWKQALAYTKLFYILKDSLFSINKHKQISEIEAKYQNEKKSKEITALKHEAVLDQSKIQRQRLIILFTVIIAGLVLVYTFFLIQQNKEIRRIYRLLSRKQKDLTDSIVYAEKIQQAVLPSPAYITSLLPDNFVIYKPKAIVGGDFYWLASNDKYIFLAVADCTGHGVPGGFLSMLGITFLNQLIIAFPDAFPSKILNELNKLIYKSLNPDAANHSSREGMDVGLCRVERENGEIYFAGSRIPLLYTEKGKLNKIKGEVWPLGYLSTDQNLFKDKLVPVKRGEMFYLYTDGYIHQYGEEFGQKFGQKRFMGQLLEIHRDPLDLQKAVLESKLMTWKRSVDQFDDVLVFGTRVGDF